MMVRSVPVNHQSRGTLLPTGLAMTGLQKLAPWIDTFESCMAWGRQICWGQKGTLMSPGSSHLSTRTTRSAATQCEMFRCVSSNPLLDYQARAVRFTAMMESGKKSMKSDRSRTKQSRYGSGNNTGICSQQRLHPDCSSILHLACNERIGVYSEYFRREISHRVVHLTRTFLPLRVFSAGLAQ
jgi:hypothetical protein